MPGKHEPPRKGSFYLSLATSTLRALLVVGAVAAGVVILTRAFPGSGDGGVQAPRTAPPVVASPTATPTPTETPTPRATVTPQVEGVVVAVLNGTTETGLAAATAERLKGEGYVIKEVGNAESTDRTTIFFRGRDQGRANAQYLRDTFFTEVDALVKRLPKGIEVSRGVQLTIVLGLDWAAAQPTEG